MKLILGIFGGLLFVIIMYVLMAISLQKMADDQGIENSFLAWIPIANLYLTGLIVGDELDVGEYTITSLSLVLPIASVVGSAASVIPFIGTLLEIAIYVLNIIVFNRIVKLYIPEKAKLYTIISIIFPPANPVLYFIVSRKDLVDGGAYGVRVEYSEGDYDGEEGNEEDEHEDEEDWQ